MIVRPAAPADAGGIFRLWSGLHTHNEAVDTRIRSVRASEEELATALAASIARKYSAIFVAVVDTDVAGFLSGGIEQNAADRLPERVATVGYMYVDEGYRRQGVGRRLFGAFEEWASLEDDVEHVEMPVLAHDSNAAAFWASMGFSPFIQRLWAPLRRADR